MDFILNFDNTRFLFKELLSLMRQSGDMKKFSAYYKNKFSEVIPTSSELIKTTQFKCFCIHLKIQATKSPFLS